MPDFNITAPCTTGTAGNETRTVNSIFWFYNLDLEGLCTFRQKKKKKGP